MAPEPMALRDPHRTCRLLLHQPAVAALAALCRELGDLEAFLVGGVLRDRLLGLPAHDFDAVVSGRGEEIARRLAARLGARFVALGGEEFGAYRLVGDDWELDLWDHHGQSFAADLARRDLTLNTLALRLSDGTLVDAHGGLADLGRRILRATTPTSFEDDPLRVLRLVRLWLQLPGFSVDPPTLELAHAAAPRLVEVAAERIRSELERIFRHPEAAQGLSLLATLDLYPGLWLGAPGELAGRGADAAKAARELALLGPAARELRALAGGDPPFPIDHAAARWALTFTHLPNAEQGAADALEAFARAGLLPRRDAARVARLLPWRKLPLGLPEDRRFLHQLGPLWTTAVCVAGAAALADHGRLAWQAAARALVLAAREGGADLLGPPKLVDGTQAAAWLGLPPGKELGAALAALRAAQVDGTVTNAAEAQAFLRRLRDAGGLTSPAASD